MGDTLQSILAFINENTTILIGICVFLIVVLIGYLIDNSVKSKRIRNDIKNADQVPKKIKDEIIQEAKIDANNDKVVNLEQQDNKTVDVVEPVKTEPESNLNEEITPTVDLNTVLNLNQPSSTEDLNTELNLNSAPNEELNIDTVSNNTLNQGDNINAPLNLDINLENNDTPLFNIDNKQEDLIITDTTNSNTDSSMLNIDIGVQPNIQNTTETDPDEYLLDVNKNTSEYKNDKKLSEILLGYSKKDLNSESKDINTENTYNQSDELDRIMRKLSSMNNSDEDNYTNIF